MGTGGGVRGSICGSCVYPSCGSRVGGGADSVPELRSQTQTQMSSAPEVSYVSNVSDPTQRTVSFNDNWKFNLATPAGAQGGLL